MESKYSLGQVVKLDNGNNGTVRGILFRHDEPTLLSVEYWANEGTRNTEWFLESRVTPA